MDPIEKEYIYNAVYYLNPPSKIKKTVNNLADEKATSSSPLDLTKNDLIKYQIILNSYLAKNPTNNITKISKHNPLLKRQNLPCSILKYPRAEGFYVLGSKVGKGMWGSVKETYFVDKNYNMHKQPIVDKVVCNKPTNDILKELFIFTSVYPSRKLYLNKFGVRSKGIKKDVFIEKLPGVDLSKYLEDAIDLDIQKRISIAYSFVLSLYHIHNQDIVHLDLHSGNILFDPITKKVSIIDFGCAESTGKEIRFWFPGHPKAKFGIDTAPPEVGELVGTEKKIKVSAAMDIYQAAITIGEILGVPFENLMSLKLKNANQSKKEDTPTDLEKLSSKDPKALSFLNRHISEAKCNFECDSLKVYPKIINLLNKMTAKDPASRPNVKEVSQVLMDQCNLKNEKQASFCSPARVF